MSSSSTSLSPSNSAMQQVLLMPELLEQIFENLRTGGINIPYDQLLSVALTCRTFNRPALASLWSNLPTFEPVVRVLSQDCWEEISTPSPRGWKDVHVQLRPKRRITKDDCDRLSFYRKQVRHITLDSGEMKFAAVDPDFFEQLGRIFGATSIFPGLQHVRWWCQDTKVVPLWVIKHLTAPTLEGVCFKTFMDTESAHSIQQVVNGSTCPGIKELKIILHDNHPTGESLPDLDFLPLLKSFDNLQHVELAQLSTESYLYLMTKSGPGTLSLSFSCFSEMDWDAIHGTRGFSHLRTLHLTAGCYRTMDVETLSRLFGTLKAPLLDLEIENIEGPITGDDWGRLFAQISDGTTGELLERLVLSESVFVYQESSLEEKSGITGLNVAPLLRFSRLSELSLTTHLCYNLEDEDIRLMAKSFPNLAGLHLQTYSRRTGLLSLTTNCLVYLVALCPRLTRISLYIRPTLSNLVEALGMEKLSGLSCLNSNSSSLLSNTDLEAILDTLFPDVTSESRSGGYFCRSRWSGVRKDLAGGDAVIKFELIR
ncbi:hypothetical protein BDN72DRAFT_879663 [Pluteus cervinus]|uniref:Uncharacterized protein n=1 Tax=Pluteus cervinus TaxID=181527 RepID=A0ACD3API2_9AGAR|nr:hypothetical protein BDN72DRAFT_879663 [Pluteus cervinus]